MIRFGLRNEQTTYQPGDTISGAALWEFTERKKSIEVRLVWSTRGKGTEDGATVATQVLDARKLAHTETFSFTAPDAPYSFNGTLIALIWAVEFVAEPGEEFERIEITIAPSGREIVLPRIPQPKANAGFKRGRRFLPLATTAKPRQHPGCERQGKSIRQCKDREPAIPVSRRHVVGTASQAPR